MTTTDEFRLFVHDRGAKDRREWLIRQDESVVLYTNRGDGSDGDASALVLQANALKFGGHCDWRIPELVELDALVGSPEEPSGGKFWSSSPPKIDGTAPFFQFFFGEIGAESQESRLHVRLVRSITPALTHEEELAQWSDLEPSRSGSVIVGIGALVDRIASRFHDAHPDVRVLVRRYADDGAVEVFATIDGVRASCWTECFARSRLVVAEDVWGMRAAFPSRTSTGIGCAHIDRFPILVSSLVGSVAALIVEIGVQVCEDNSNEAWIAFCDRITREALAGLGPRCYKIRVGSRIFTYGVI